MTLAFQSGAMILLIGGILFAFSEPLRALVALWSNVPMYSYGYTVPVISGYLVWARRAELAALDVRPDRLLALVVLLTAIAMLLLGQAAGLVVLQQLAFVVALVGVAFAAVGKAIVRVAWAGLAYLLLMVPIWDGFTEPLHWPFQLRSANLGTFLLRLVGIPAHVEGTVVALPNVTLEVARACSGVNYLVAVAALGLPLAYLYLRGVWRRLALIVAALVVAAVSNGLRVALIGVLAYLEIGSPLHGPFHVLHGLFVAAIGYVVLFAGLRLLSGPPSAPSSWKPGDARRRSYRSMAADLVVIGVLFWSTGILLRARHAEPVLLETRLDELPIVLGRWIGEQSPETVALPAAFWPGADQELGRRYTSTGESPVNVYIGYFSAQDERREVGSFESDELHQGAAVVPLRFGPAGELAANYVPHLRNRDAAALFWYEIDGLVETSRLRVKMRTAWNSLARRRSNAAVVMVWSRAAGSREPREQLEEIAAEVYRALGRVLPGRVRAAALPESSREIALKGETLNQAVRSPR